MNNKNYMYMRTKTAPSGQTTSSVEDALTIKSLLTYESLLEHGSAYMRQQGMGNQQVKNICSALRSWLEVHGFSAGKLLGDEFRQDFDRHFLRYCDAISERVAPRTQKDRQEQILRWRRVAEALRKRDTLPESFAAALAHCTSASPLSKAEIARTCGISPQTLAYWTSGLGAPRGESLFAVAKLEEVLEVPVGSLTGRVPLARHTRYARGARRDTSSTFTNLRKAQLKQVKKYGMAFTPRLAMQWLEVIHHKTSIDDEDEGGRIDRTWRLKPIDTVTIRVTPAMLADGQICVTAGVQWGMVRSYLGWLCLARPVGRGVTVDCADTLAWLTDVESLKDYAKWLERRSANVFHNGINVFLQTIESHLRPKTGFVWLRHDLAETINTAHHAHWERQSSNWQSVGGWQARCEATRVALRRYREFKVGKKPIPKSRNPVERVAVVLNDQFPLKKLVEFVNTLERSMPPPAHHRDYCAWIRDVVLCKLLISNPLRIGQYAAMTYRADGNGHLVRVGPGRWRLNFKPSDFKNEKGAATEPYSVAVDDSVAPWIDRYLAEARPYLVGAEQTSRFLLPAAKGPRSTPQFLSDAGLSQTEGYKGDSLSARLKHLTALYIDGCPGFAAHSFRHAIATDHLRRNPGDYLTVAILLHDKLETVLRNYSHLKVEDGLRRLSTGIQLAQQQLAAARGQPAMSVGTKAL